MPDLLAEAVAMTENHGNWRVIGPADLGVQRNAVVGQDGDRTTAELAEGLVGGGIRLQPYPSDRYLFRGDHCARGRGCDPSGKAGDASESPPPGHWYSCPPRPYRRRAVPGCAAHRR